MKALVRHQFGGPAWYASRRSSSPRSRTTACSSASARARLNKADWHELRGWPRFLRPVTRNGVLRPKNALFGSDFAGVVEAVGKDVTDFAPGDEVFGGRTGAFAEYVSATNRRPGSRPTSRSRRPGRWASPGLTALQGLRDKGELQPGERVLINGASGGVGTLAVQIAKALGGHVTAVCSTRNVEQARALGADRVLDHTREDFTRGARALRPDRRRRGRPLVALAAARPRAGRPARPRRRARQPQPAWATSPRSCSRRASASTRSSSSSRTSTSRTSRRSPTCSKAAQLKPAIDRTYELAEAQDAFRTYGEGHVRGKLVLTI